MYEYPVGDKIIRLFLGDLTTLDVDALVNSANTDLWMGSGVAYAIKEAGGKKIEDEARKHAPCPMGKVVVTKAGKLKAKYILHAVTMGQDYLPDIQTVRTASEAAVAQADSMKLKTMAFPAMGVGVGLLAPEIVAFILTDIVLKRLPSCKSVREIVFSLTSEQTYRFFEQALPPSF